MEEKTSVEAVVAVAVALIGTAIYLRRRYGSVGEMWTAALARGLRFDRAAVFKAVLALTALLWAGAWVFTTSDQRAAWKKTFYENSPFAPVLDKVDSLKD